jgi:cellulose synthase/poly-beta-1,6-N-acetylglucosamine synthase-like glycosyltransferase
MDTAAFWGFWLSVVYLAYVYAGFPALVAVVGRLTRRDVRKASVTPPLTLVIAAYNEEAVIAARLDNALESDYPPDRLQILVASDGSTDGTERIVGGYAARGVQLLPLPRRGKIHALDDAVRQASGEIVVFSDANTMCVPGALRALASNFADPEVGGVAGRTGYQLPARGESSSRGECLYWDYDTRLKQLESFTGSVVSAHGGLYAIRRSLYQPSPDAAVTDDFAISTAVVDQGYRLVFEPAACATEVAVDEAQREFGRRVRLMTRGLRGVLMRRRLLNPFRTGFYAVVLFSHKVARRLAPLALIALAASSAALVSQGALYRLAALGQAAFYALAVCGYLLRRASIGGTRLLYVPFFYCMANTASAIALYQLLRGRRIERWQPQRHGAT